ncbi:MAG: hypothetical protein PHF35_03465 [Candidatus Moranbacteria bacterium]|nr:hypothetical protein [Candidatus Moranbacteria bacterium]
MAEQKKHTPEELAEAVEETRKRFPGSFEGEYDGYPKGLSPEEASGFRENMRQLGLSRARRLRPKA